MVRAPTSLLCPLLRPGLGGGGAWFGEWACLTRPVTPKYVTDNPPLSSVFTRQPRAVRGTPSAELPPLNWKETLS